MDILDDCVEGAREMFCLEQPAKKSAEKTEEEPVDVMVDALIGLLEVSTAYMRTVANQVFTHLAASVQGSTVALITTQLERRDPVSHDGEGDDESPEDSESSGSNPANPVDSDATSSSGDEDKEDSVDDNDEGDVDEEFRRKIEEALRINGIEAASQGSDSSGEELFDDGQMIAIDEQLAEVFRSQASNKKPSKDTDAQREATHFKNRVLDLVDIYMKAQPKNPLLMHFIVPLVDLIQGTGVDEKQLSDKAAGLLKSRVGKSKETPSPISINDTKALLEELHSRARRAHSSDTLLILGGCSLFVSKALIHAGEPGIAIAAYSKTLSDFIKRKASPLNSKFFEEFIRRQPTVAMQLAPTVMEAAKSPANAYRACQAIQLLNLLVSQRELGAHPAALLDLMPMFSESLYDVVVKSCNDDLNVTGAQMKDLFKTALSAKRLTTRYDPSASVTSWSGKRWQSLHLKLQESSRFKSSKGLHTLCAQLGQGAEGGKAKTVAADATKLKRKLPGAVDRQAKKARQGDEIRRTKSK